MNFHPNSEMYYRRNLPLDCSGQLNYGLNIQKSPHYVNQLREPASYLDAYSPEETLATQLDQNLQDFYNEEFQAKEFSNPLGDDLFTNDFYQQEFNKLLSFVEHGGVNKVKSVGTESEMEQLCYISKLADVLLERRKRAASAALDKRLDFDTRGKSMSEELMMKEQLQDLQLMRLKLRRQIQLKQLEWEEELMYMKQQLLQRSRLEKYKHRKPQQELLRDPSLSAPSELWEGWNEEYVKPMGTENASGSQGKRYEEQAAKKHSTQNVNLNQKEKDKKEVTRRRHCRHFLKGHCNRGTECGFLHDHSIFCTDRQKIFLGGLPSYITPKMLKEILEGQGYVVLNQPKVLRGFSPQVCLGSIDEAKNLIAKGSIVINGRTIEVRPFEAFTKDNEKKLPDEVERSVFLGGLSDGTTSQDINESLLKKCCNVVNSPVVRAGFSPQVILETVEQAQLLLNFETVEINGVPVSVRPFANIRSTSGKLRNRKK